MKITLLGKGAWGGAVGDLLRDRQHDITWIEKGESTQIGQAEMVLVALPTQAVRECLTNLSAPHHSTPIVSLSKGIEIGTGKRVSEIIHELWPKAPVAVVSGPSLAGELHRKVPTAVVAVAQDESLAKKVQETLHGGCLRVYRGVDLAGVEWGGALKNIYALAAGMCAGLGLGENSLAGLVTRSLREMVRVAVSFGAHEETLQGLSGVGDLILTSYSRASRNRTVGERMGAGEPLAHALSLAEGVCEGVSTTEAIYPMIVKNKIKAPVATELHRVLFEGKSPREALGSLLDRDPRAEAE